MLGQWSEGCGFNSLGVLGPLCALIARTDNYPRDTYFLINLTCVFSKCGRQLEKLRRTQQKRRTCQHVVPDKVATFVTLPSLYDSGLTSRKYSNY